MAPPLRRAEIVDAVVTAVVREAEWLGVTGRGALSGAGRALVGRERGAPADLRAAATAMASHLPSPVEHVLLQADLTAVAPGRLEGSLAQFMRLVADVESRGGATVYRFSAASLRRGLDAGWSSAQILTGLQDASRTPVPQPLEYLVGDVARRHGQTRVGSVTSYIRSDDETVLDSMLADRGLSALQLRRIAPTVLVSPVLAATTLDMLRDNGFAPVAESTDGGVMVPPTSHHRTPARRAPVLRRAQLGGGRGVHRDAAWPPCARARRRRTTTGPARSPSPARGCPRPSRGDPRAVARRRRGPARGVDRLRRRRGPGDADVVLPQADRRWPGGRHVDGSNIERAFSIHRITGAASA